MRASLRAPVGALLAVLLVSCGGGQPGSPPAALPASTSSPGNQAPIVSVGSPNVSSSDDAADWTSARYDPSGSGYNPSQTAVTESNVKTLAPTWIFQGTVGSESSVAIQDGVVYRTELGSNVYAINETTGEQIWNFAPTAAEGFGPSPLIHDGLLYLPSGTGDFFAISAQTGVQQFAYPPNPLWGPNISFGYRGHYRGSPVFENGMVYEGASNHSEPDNCIEGGQVSAFDPTSAQIAISTSTTPSGQTGDGVWSTPVFDASGDMFVATGNTCNFSDVPFGDSMLRMNALTLDVVWATPGPLDAHDWDFGSTPVVVGNEVVDGGKDGYVYAFDTQTGQLLWKQTPWPNGEAEWGVASDGAYIAVPFAVSTDPNHGGIAVFDLNGNLVWSFVTGMDPADPRHGVDSPPAISNGMVFVGYTKPNCSSSCDGIGAFDEKTGELLWFYPTPSPVFGGIAVVQGGVFASTLGNPLLYCFQPQTGAQANRRPRMTYGTHAGGFKYFHNPWLKTTDVEGDNTGSNY